MSDDSMRNRPARNHREIAEAGATTRSAQAPFVRNLGAASLKPHQPIRPGHAAVHISGMEGNPPQSAA